MNVPVEDANLLTGKIFAGRDSAGVHPVTVNDTETVVNPEHGSGVSG